MARGKYEQPRHLNTNKNNGKRAAGVPKPANMRRDTPQVAQIEGKFQNKPSKKAKTAALILLTTTVAVTSSYGSIYLYKNHIEHEKQNKADEFVKEYMETGATFLALPEQIQSDATKDEMFMEGRYLEESILKEGIEFIKIGEDYYTEDGSEIVILTVDVITNEYAEPIKYTLSDGSECGLPPSGYQFDENTGKCIKTTAETKTLYYKTGVAPTPNEDGMISSGKENVECYVVDAQTKPTYKYEEIAENGLYIDGEPKTKENSNEEVRKLVLDNPTIK